MKKTIKSTKAITLEMCCEKLASYLTSPLFITLFDTLLNKMNKILDVVKLSLLENTLLLQVAFNYQLPMSQIVEDRSKVARVTINQIGTSVVPVRGQTDRRIILTELVEERLSILAQGGLRGHKIFAANVQAHPFGLGRQAVGADLFGVGVAICAIGQNSFSLTILERVGAIMIAIQAVAVDHTIRLGLQLKLRNFQVAVGCFKICI